MNNNENILEENFKKEREGKLLKGRIIFVVITIKIFYFIGFQKSILISKLDVENKVLKNKIEKMNIFLKENNLIFIEEKVESVNNKK